ncbi:MAG: hypothetical protein JXR84_09780 [Anaerolineae bacterium]|nr:hypothetical protein [Anaerolineae bacterium]
MAIKYQIDPEMGVIYVNLAGTVHDLDFVTAVDEALHDPGYRAGINSLIDFRAVERFDVSNQTIRRAVGMVSDQLDDYNQPWKAAIVAPANLVYGLSRMYQLLREGSMEEVGVFRDAESAREWLGLPKEDAGP